MKKMFIPIIVIIIIILVILAGGYYWWQKYQAGQLPFLILCDSLKSIPSAQYAPENVRARFLECFPERATSTVPSAPTEQGPTCDELKAIPSAQYAPSDIRDKFLKCFPERKQ